MKNEFKESATFSSNKKIKKISHSPTVITDVEYCRMETVEKLNEGENSMRDVEEIVREIVKENENLFNVEELQIINNNVSIIKKIYLLGLINGKQLYK